jgi:poly(3-hydroxybutyrate) depolymerase
MRKLLTSLLLIGLGLSLQACGVKPAPEESCNFVQNADMQRVSWGGGTPVVMYIDESVPAVYRDAVKRAAATWNNDIGREVIKIGGVTKMNGPSQDGANVIYFLDAWEAERTNEQARTTVYWAGTRIYEADIRVNNRDFNFFWGSDPVSGRVDIESLILHEMGHVLGLGHSVTAKSVMAKSLPSATLRRDLSADDLSSIRCEY